MTSINIDDFPIEIDPDIDDDFLSIVIDNYRFLSIVIITDKLYFFCDFDFYRFPITIDISRQIEWSINIDDIDFYRVTTSGMSVKCIQSRKGWSYGVGRTGGSILDW